MKGDNSVEEKQYHINRYYGLFGSFVKKEDIHFDDSLELKIEKFDYSLRLVIYKYIYMCVCVCGPHQE